MGGYGLACPPTRPVVEAMPTGLARSTGQGRLHIKEQIFSVAFPDRPWSSQRPFSEMSAIRQRVVRFVAALEPGTWPGFPFDDGAWGGPDQIDRQTYAGLACDGL